MGATTKKPPQRATPVGRDLAKVHRFAKDLLAQHGLSDIWSVFWAESLENSNGGGATRTHTKRIVFSAAHIALLAPAERRDTVRHEVAHAIVGAAAGHSEAWRSKAIELGGSGLAQLTHSALLYPWYGRCPDGHAFTSVRPPASTGFTCRDDSHDEPVELEWWEKNAKSRALDPGVKRMAEEFPEPEPPAPAFSVGETVYLVPFGHKLDNAPMTVVEVKARQYVAHHADMGEDFNVDFEAVAAAPAE
ncbi:hypothetical protein [Isoptericola croceus]|uniref:hypothetical protein n=1 Tax=Isoptericola croceus TaxID=3031406 RepID=UPI0023F86C3A|nr:hypothetical protein [Isoptericola croceus]